MSSQYPGKTPQIRVATATLAYNEQRFIKPFLQHIPRWVEERLVLVSTKPWFGKNDRKDDTAQIARKLGASVIEWGWRTEATQRNAGQEFLNDFDWIIVLDPDEFMTRVDWGKLYHFLATAKSEAYVCDLQHTYWKNGYKVEPPEDYKQIIAVKPSVRFYDKRCVNCDWEYAPIELHHFSWARTNEEIWSKISHFSHAKEFDRHAWFNDIWLSNKKENLHPLTPKSLKKIVKTKLPEELERLDLWPSQSQ